ncbi:hypothetical protein VTJ83DRAFT_5505 [Remersonia thermophila]|uniref:G-patch domain-containing protein n=1 Tax=Remersonia thermophila TaxID=72144 RepID=A0ABR4D713_9PEZI
MSYKRSRAAYEADLAAQQSSYVVFGTPLPPLDPDVRDDGSYVPLWKQEVRDERGRKRFHGAFTGGWSAGYFNTVGSKEGWTPSSFVSSRTHRRKDDPNAVPQRPEDFMDEEDLADLEESRRVQTRDAFSGLGSTADDAARRHGLMGLFRAEGDTMGTRLLKKMGWKEGQGVGPKVRRQARLHLRADGGDSAETYLFAPDNVPMITFVRKTDHKGLGYVGETRLAPLGRSAKAGNDGDNNDDDDDDSDPDGTGPGLGRPRFTLSSGRTNDRPRKKGGIGVGVLNDTGSDDEDPYEMGPRISYNRVIGGDKKKKKKAATAANPALKTQPAFMPSKKAALAKISLGLRKCHDGRLPLDGFVFGREPDALTAEVNAPGKYPPPEIPPGWVSAKQAQPQAGKAAGSYVSAADAAKASTLDPRARAAILGEKQLPGKSVFDFMTPEARARLAAVTGRQDLPPARGEVPAEHALSEADRAQQLLSRVPKLDKETAVAAISRGAGGNAPYRDDDAKRARYIAFLEYQAGFRPSPGPQPPKMNADEWLRELHEFYSCARIFKPMTGFMASRFTTSSASTAGGSGSGSGSSNETGGGRDIVSKPASKPEDPAEEAAKLGMFGPMTRSVTIFHPVRLLCKRMGVAPPEHATAEDAAGSGRPAKPEAAWPQFEPAREARASGGNGHDAPSQQQQDLPDVGALSSSTSAGVGLATAKLAGGTPAPEAPGIDTSRNPALEGKRAGEEVFKAIFGDSDDDDE